MKHHLDELRRQPAGFSMIELLVVVALMAVITLMAIPMTGNALASFRVSGDAREVSNSMAVAKMRAASTFSRTRLYVDLVDGSHHVDTWDKTAHSGAGGWVTEGGDTYLSTGVSFGYGPATAPPPDTQGTIGQAGQCLDDTGTAIGNTACIIFNSRGVPVDTTLAPTGDDAVYLTDGITLYAITIAATGMQRVWTAVPSATPIWNRS